jgi:pyruvate carboxylase
MPGGQYTNLYQQAKSLGLGDRWQEVCDAYAAANQLFGDIVKVTPSSKVVGDMALFMVTNNLKPEDILSSGKQHSFPRSVVEMMQGMLGRPEEGWPKVIQKVILDSARVKPIHGRPGAKLPRADFAAATKELAARIHRQPGDEEVLSYLLYPQVFLDFQKHLDKFDDTSVLATGPFFFGLQPGEETSVEIEEGKTLIVKFLTTSDVHDDGTRTVFYELNGQPREVRVPDHSVEGRLHTHPKADPDDANHVASPMPGKVSTVAVKKGQEVKAGERLLSIEAMKMETAVYAPRDAKIADVLVKAGSVVGARDLLVVLE